MRHVNSRPLRIALVAGEASGDLLASHLIQALSIEAKGLGLELQCFGIGGPKMERVGFDAWWPLEKLAVRGYVEVLKHYREISSIRSKLKRRLLENPPDVFIGVDAPDFNLGLEEVLKKRGIPVVHYVSPSIWAWRGGRIRRIAKSVTHMLCLFPFEEPIYTNHGVRATYVGHPLADVIPEQLSIQSVREKIAVPPELPVFALLPGSRQSELAFMAETFIRTAALLTEKYPEAHFLVPLTTRETRLQFEEAIYRLGAQNLSIRLLFGHAQEAMAAADVVLVASGTATLEAGLVKRPMVITYKMASLTYQVMKRMAYQPWVGLPNILAARPLVPEILQDKATPHALADELARLYAERHEQQPLQDELLRQHRLLRQGAAQKAARAVMAYLPVPQG